MCLEVHYFRPPYLALGRWALPIWKLGLAIWGNVHEVVDNFLPSTFLFSLPEISTFWYCTSWTSPLIFFSLFSILWSLLYFQMTSSTFSYNPPTKLFIFQSSFLFSNFFKNKILSCVWNICLHEDTDSFFFFFFNIPFPHIICFFLNGFFLFVYLVSFMK